MANEAKYLCMCSTSIDECFRYLHSGNSKQQKQQQFIDFRAAYPRLKLKQIAEAAQFGFQCTAHKLQTQNNTVFFYWSIFMNKHTFVMRAAERRMGRIRNIYLLTLRRVHNTK